MLLPLRAPLAAAALAALAAVLAVLAPTGGRHDGTARVAAGLTLGAKAAKAPALRHPQSRTRSVRAARTVTASAAGRIPNDPFFASSWALRAIQAPLAWQRTTGSPDVVVAVLDTGVNGAVPDLAGAVVSGANLVAGAGEPHDDHGHGTLVAGVIAARGDNGIGVAGLCWACSLMPVKVVGADGRGSAATVAAGIRFAVDNGADVINLSLVLNGSDGQVAGAVRDAVARGVVVVSAAGNTGSTSPVYPAAEPGVVGVAAVDESGAPYGWSGRGAWVRVAAPGCVQTTGADGSYPLFCGTSAATAVVSGLVALALSTDPSAPSARALEALELAAVPLSDAASAGRVDAAATLALVAPAAAPTAPLSAQDLWLRPLSVTG